MYGTVRKYLLIGGLRSQGILGGLGSTWFRFNPLIEIDRFVGCILLQKIKSFIQYPVLLSHIARPPDRHSPRQLGNHYPRWGDQPDQARIPGDHHRGNAVYLKGSSGQSHGLMAHRSDRYEKCCLSVLLFGYRDDLGNHLIDDTGGVRLIPHKADHGRRQPADAAHRF